MKVLSLFDGMSCGMIAMRLAGLTVERYDAWEIDKYAVTASKHNFPEIIHHGDVFDADFMQYRGYNFLMGGSPCTYWSIAQSPDKRETTASGIGWELFSQYVRALHEAKPRMFIYENNKSMSKEIRASITETFGFEPICINSALVSAQNRQRLYWVGVRNADGTYRKASIEQPADRGILLKDVLDSAVAAQEKGYAILANEWKDNPVSGWLEKHRRTKVAEPVGIKPLGGLNNSHQRRVVYDTTGKTPTLVAGAGAGAGGGNIPLVSEETPLRDKMYTLDAQYGRSTGVYNPEKQHSYSRHAVAVPACVASRGRNPDDPSDRTAGAPTEQRYEAHEDGKTNTLTSVSKDNLIADPIRIGTMPSAEGRQGGGQAMRIYDPDGKSTTLKANAGGGGGKTGLYATQEKPAKQQRVYTVQDGQIEVNGKRYPIKLKDGQYIIRKLTVTECMRLQTVPEWYDFSCVSNTQAYKMLGNGWTCEVIAHLIRGAMKSSIFGI